MDWIRVLLTRCSALFRKRKLDADLDEELWSHINLAIEENRKRGMTEAEARGAALRKFGGVTQTKERYRMQRGLPFVETLGSDLRFALRQLRKSPGFTVTAVLTLALGIGATTAIFTLVHQVMLKSLPVSKPEELWRIGDKIRCCNWGGYTQGDDQNFSMFSWEAYKNFRALTPEFTDLAAIHQRDAQAGSPSPGGAT